MALNRSTRRTDWQEIHNAVNLLELSDLQRTVLRGQLICTLHFWDEKARRGGRKHLWLRTAATMAGVTVPVLVGLKTAEWSTEIYWITICLSLVAVLANALDDLWDFGQSWRHFRGTAEEARFEFMEYLTRTGEYAGQTDEDGFLRFAHRMNTLGLTETKARTVELRKREVDRADRAEPSQRSGVSS
jgi:hypothetical protein